MATFTFTARDTNGRLQQGSLDAPTAAGVVGILRGRGWVVVRVVPRPDSRRSGELTLSSLSPANLLPVRSVDVEVSLRQMAVMLRSGLTLLSALQTVSEQSPRRAMRRIWQDVSRRIQEGSSLAEALGQHSAFPSLVVQLVRVGEQTGQLESVLSRASETLEERRFLRSQLLTAMAYPSLVLVAAIGVTVFIIVGVIPKLQNFLSALGRELPMTTQLLIDISSFITNYGLYGVIGAAAMIAGVFGIRTWPPARLWMDRHILRVPVIGTLLRLSGTVLLTRSLGTLIRSGVTLLEGLRTSERLLGNQYLVLQVAQSREAVMQGEVLSKSLETKGAFMPMLSSMVSVGESAGTLDEVLDEVSRYYQDQLQRSIRRLALLVEPAIIVVVGAIVGFVYISFFMALFAAAGGS